MHIKRTKIKLCMYTVWGLKYDDFRKDKTCPRGTSFLTENAMFILFVLESEKIVRMSGL